jgi:glycosyltransferase involved in cell wall biosynthesis
MPQGSIPARDRHIYQKRLFDMVIERSALLKADGVVATSEAEVDALVRWGIGLGKVHRLPEFGEWLPSPSETRAEMRQELGIPHDAPLLVWSGRVHRIKGMDLLFRVVATHPALRGVFVVLMGDDEGDGEARRWRIDAQHLGIAQRVLFQGWCDAQTRSNHYGAADAFVLPSIQESFSRAAAEALISGLPLIASETSGIVQHAKQGSLVFRREKEDLGRVLRTFVESPELRQVLAEGALSLADTLSPERAVAALERIYCLMRTSSPCLPPVLQVEASGTGRVCGWSREPHTDR